MKKQVIYILLLVGLFVIGFFTARNYDEEIKTVKRTQILMGTVVDIQIRNIDLKTADELISKAFAEIKRVDNLFNVMNSGTVWEINQNPDSVITANNEIYQMMLLCDSLFRLSSGSFDASIGSLISLWGFDKKEPELPADKDIKKALLKSRWNNIILPGKNKVYRRGNVIFNFNSLAKGYAVDRAVEILKNEGVEEALVNAGGEIKSTGGTWTIGIQHPREVNGIIKKIELKDMSVATSGDYENYFELNGIRYHHLLDPKTGFPAKGIQSVTIIHKSNSFADGLATAVFVLGKKKGFDLIENLVDTEAMIIDDKGKSFYTSGFKNYVIN